MIDDPYYFEGMDKVLSPSLLVFVDLVHKNLETMVSIAGSPDRLRPHVKTHKMPKIVGMIEAMGIRKHKCATIAEAEMVARAGGTDVLLGYPLVGPNVGRFAALTKGLPETTFRATVDHEGAARALSKAMEAVGRTAPVLMDMEVGMGRTGIAAGEEAIALYDLIATLPNLQPDGLHAYDGHIQDKDPAVRAESIHLGREQAMRTRDELLARGLSVPRVVLGGTPSFAAHARAYEPGFELSPGVCTLHDGWSLSKYPELPFTPAGLVLTRVISRPRPGRVCLDVGHKAIAADPAPPRMMLVGVTDPQFGTHNEEHLIVDTPDADRLPPGTPLPAIPMHVCPTVALHAFAYAVEGGRVVDRWEVVSRDRVLTY